VRHVALVAPAARASASNRQKVVSRTLFFSFLGCRSISRTRS